MMSSGADPRMRWARTFGTDPDRYDRARPRYPESMVERILAASPGREVLDVGCGTGIVARQFQAAGASVHGVDPDARMAALARAGGLDVEVSAFEEWDPAGRTFDAVVAGQAWHWVDPEAGAAKAAQALRPGGRLAVFWNAGEASPELTEAFSEVHGRVVPDPRGNMWARPALEGFSPVLGRTEDGIRLAGRFGDPEQWRYRWDWTYSREAWLDQLPTHGAHTQLAPEQLERLLTGAGAVIDAAGGSFTMRYTTVVVTAAAAGGDARARP